MIPCNGIRILPTHRDGERRASEGDPEGAFGGPQREPTARDTAEWWRPMGAIECSRSRAVGGVSGMRSEGDPEGAFRPRAARARPAPRAERAEGPLRARSTAPEGAAPRSRHSRTHPSAPVGSRTAPSSKSYTKPWRPNSSTTSSIPSASARSSLEPHVDPAPIAPAHGRSNPRSQTTYPPAPLSLADLLLPSAGMGRGPRPRPPVPNA